MVQKVTKRYNKAQKGTQRYKKVYKSTKRYIEVKKVYKSTKRYTEVQTATNIQEGTQGTKRYTLFDTLDFRIIFDFLTDSTFFIMSRTMLQVSTLIYTDSADSHKMQSNVGFLP